MKIIKAGVIPDVRDAWWVGKVVSCTGCHCQVELEVGDKVQTSQERHPNGAARVSVLCPTLGCDATLRASHIWENGQWVQK